MIKHYGSYTVNAYQWKGHAQLVDGLRPADARERLGSSPGDQLAPQGSWKRDIIILT